jgi:osmotically-inducible protein OsmY
MSKWILMALLGAAFACERERPRDETGGEVGAERGAETQTEPSETGTRAEDAEGEMREGAGDAGQKMKDFGRDVKEGAEDVGRDVKEGAEDVGRDAEREWKERTGEKRQGTTEGSATEAPRAQEQLGAQSTEVVQGVRQKLMDADLSLAAKNVQIMAEGGKVTLRGDVPSEGERARVEQLARSVPGVTDVDNRLEIGAE